MILILVITSRGQGRLQAETKPVPQCVVEAREIHLVKSSGIVQISKSIQARMRGAGVSLPVLGRLDVDARARARAAVVAANPLAGVVVAAVVVAANLQDVVARIN